MGVSVGELNITGISEMIEKLSLTGAAAMTASRAAARQIAGELEAYAKGNHPWSVRTGNTNQSTKGTVVEPEENILEIVLSAGMDYDVFLELAREGKWAWLWPAIIANEDRIRLIFAEELRKGVSSQ